MLLGPPGTGKTHLAIALGIRACLAGQRVDVQDRDRVGRHCSPTPNATAASMTSSPGCSASRLLICDEVGYIPFDPQAANLMFMLVARRYERASLIVTSQQAVQRVGRDLRRRSHRHRDDRPPRSPRRDPQPQRRQLPPQRPRPRPPTGRQTRPNSLTDHPRPARRGPQNASTSLDPGPTRLPGALRRLARGERRSGSPSGLASATHTATTGGSVFDRRRGVSFRPALTLVAASPESASSSRTPCMRPGRREIIGLEVGEAETEAFWTEFLRSLVAQGPRRGADGDQRRAPWAEGRDRNGPRVAVAALHRAFPA